MSFRAVMKSNLNPNMPHITPVTFKGLSTSPKTKFRVQESKQQIKSLPGISGQRRTFPYEWINRIPLLKQTTPVATISCCTIYTIPYRLGIQVGNHGTEDQQHSESADRLDERVQTISWQNVVFDGFLEVSCLRQGEKMAPHHSSLQPNMGTWKSSQCF